jgi:hypothetical protein
MGSTRAMLHPAFLIAAHNRTITQIDLSAMGMHTAYEMRTLSGVHRLHLDPLFQEITAFGICYPGTFYFIMGAFSGMQ